MSVLSNLDMLKIELEAVDHCCNRRDFDPLKPPATQMNDNDYRHAIREEFSGQAEWEDWMVEPLLDEVKENIKFREQMDGMVESFLSAGMTSFL